MLFFRFKKADHRWWKLINYALTWARPNLFLSIFMPVARMLQHVVFVYLANTLVLCYSLTIIYCCQDQNCIYLIISTGNDHRQHHKFIKYEKRLRKEGNMPRPTYEAESLPLPREFGRVAHPSVRSNWSPTYILHLFHLEDNALLFLFLSESVKVRFLPLVDTFSFAQESHVVYCF
jgi:hypothetical protein